jgi:hypothetical protein
MGSNQIGQTTTCRRALVLRCFAALLAIGAFANTARAAIGPDTTFVLQPGSTITLFSGGGTQALSGSFTWHNSGTGTSTIDGFNTTALNFTSSSYTLKLNTTPANDLGTSVFANGTTYFAEIVDATGISPSLLEISSGSSGQFIGSYHNPTQVSYSNIRLVPPNGGTFVGTMNFTAIAVPEPTCASLVAAAMLLHSAKRRR